MCSYLVGCAVRPPAVSISHPRPPAVPNSNSSLPEVEVESMTFIYVKPLIFEDIDEVIRVEVMAGNEVLAGQGVINVVGVGAVEAMRVEVVQDDTF